MVSEERKKELKYDIRKDGKIAQYHKYALERKKINKRDKNNKLVLQNQLRQGIGWWRSVDEAFKLLSKFVVNN